MRYRIEARMQRGDQPSYTFTLYERVKPGRAQHLVDREALALARRERVGDDPVEVDWHTDSVEDVDPVTVWTGITCIHVSAVPLPMD
jgi:hypothetical protein